MRLRLFRARSYLPAAAVFSLLAAGAHAEPAKQPVPDTSDLEEEEDDAEAPNVAPTNTPQGPRTPILVLPYQAIYRSVPQEKLDRATELLQKELSTKESLQVIRGAVASAEAAAPTLTGAEQAMRAAATAEASRNIAESVENRKKALVDLEKNAGALEEIAPYIEAHHALARTLMVAGQDKAARDVIDVAARLAPGFELDKMRYPRLYRRWFAEATEVAVKDRPGSVLVKSVLPGALIEIDGRQTEVAPVLLEKVMPGKHLIVARIEGVVPFSTAVMVAPGKTTEIIARYENTAGGDAVGVVTDSLSKNEIPKQAVASAAEAGKGTSADWVIFGAMAKDDDKYRVHTYVVNAKTGKLGALDVFNFDLELLTAESDVLRIVQNATSMIDKFPAGESALAVIESRARTQDLTNHFDASPEIEDPSQPRTAAKTKRDRRPIFRPLKGGSITIKDEEEN